jgi:hypothetical protein
MADRPGRRTELRRGESQPPIRSLPDRCGPSWRSLARADRSKERHWARWKGSQARVAIAARIIADGKRAYDIPRWDVTPSDDLPVTGRG